MSIDLPQPTKAFVAVRQKASYDDVGFIDWESVCFSQEECEAYAAEWYDRTRDGALEVTAICEFELSLRVVKEIGVEPEAVDSGLLF